MNKILGLILYSVIQRQIVRVQQQHQNMINLKETFIISIKEKYSSVPVINVSVQLQTKVHRNSFNLLATEEQVKGKQTGDTTRILSF